MKRFLILTVALTLSSPLSAQTTSVTNTDPYDFVVARFVAESGDFERALTLLDALQQKHPNDPIIRYERASVLLEAGQTDRSIKELRAVVASTPLFYDAQRLLGRLLLDEARTDRNKLDEALKHLQEALKLSPDDFSTGLTVMQILVSQARTTEAEQIIGPMVERAPDNRTLNLNYAQLLTKLGRGDESKVYLERVVEADPVYVPAVMQLIDIYQKAGEWKKAADLLSPLVENDATNLDLRRQQGYFYLRAGDTAKSRDIFGDLARSNPEDDRNQFFFAESLSDLGEFAKAEEIYRKLLKTSPKDAELLMSFGLNLAQQRKFDGAAEAFRSLLEVKDLPPGAVTLARTQLGAIERERGNLDSALRYARDAVIGPKGLNSPAVNLTLDILRRQKKYSDAIEFVKPLADRYNDPALYARVVEFQLRAGKVAEAQRLAAAQIKTGGKAAAAIAETYMATKKYAEAIVIYETLREKNPKELPLGFQLAAAYERAGEKAKAEKLFLELLRETPDNASILNYLGYMWADQGVNLERAQVLLEKAVSLEPQNPAFLDSLGWVYFKLGKLELAEKYLTDAVTRLPNDPTIQEHLGDLFARLGKTSKALEAYRQALKLEPEPPEGEKLRVKIAEAEKRTTIAP